MPEVLRCRSDAERRLGLHRGANALRAGKLVAFPTETVYGLGADATDPAAVRAIFEAKDRPTEHPLIVHVDGAPRARSLAATWGEPARMLAARFWPGPLTLIVDKTPTVPDVATGGLGTVGLRVPDHRIARGLVSESDRPVAAPSANRHRRLSPTRAEHVVEGLGGAVDLVLDGGPTEVGVESTIVTLTTVPPTLLRPGMIQRGAIEEAIGEVEVDVGVDEEGAHQSPGRSRKHYAPEATVRVASRGELEVRLSDASRGVAVIWRGTPPEQSPGGGPRREVLPDAAPEYAAELYAALHRLDRAGARRIWVELPPSEEPWRAVRDRLERAAAD